MAKKMDAAARQARDNETAMRPDQRFDYSAIVDRKPLELLHEEAQGRRVLAGRPDLRLVCGGGQSVGLMFAAFTTFRQRATSAASSSRKRSGGPPTGSIPAVTRRCFISRV